jgi:hypothetical protein
MGGGLGWGFFDEALLSDKTVAAEGEAVGGEAGLPGLAGADGGGVAQEAVVFFLLGEAGELFAEGVVGGEEGFFAVEDGRVVAGGIVPAVELHRAEAELGGWDAV